MNRLKEICVKAVLVGFAVDFGGTVVFSLIVGIIYGICLVAMQVPLHGAMAQWKSVSFLLPALIVGLGFDVLGGYVAGRVAKRAEILNGGFVGAIGIVLVFLFGSSCPLWYNVVGCLCVIPCGMAGGFLAKRRAGRISGLTETVVAATQSGGLGLAIASLILGILSVVMSFLLVGCLLGAVGLILGAVHLRERHPAKAMAWWGVGLSIFGLIVSIGFGLLYYEGYKHFEKTFEPTNPEETISEWEGVMAPDVTVRTLDGRAITLSDLKGKRVVLDFWATWCPPCRKEIPHFIQLSEDVSTNELCVVGISSEDEETLNTYVRKEGINYPIAVAQDKDLPSPYGEVRSIPTTFVVDRKGVIQSVLVGYHDYEALKAAAMAEDFSGPVKQRNAGNGLDANAAPSL